MPAVTIRNHSDEAHRALKVRAAQHNRSMEAEIRAILETAVRPEKRLRLGTALSEISRKIGLTNADVAIKARKAGKGFPTPDGYIAAIAAAHGFAVVSRNAAPFMAAGLTIIDPWSAG